MGDEAWPGRRCWCIMGAVSGGPVPRQTVDEGFVLKDKIPSTLRLCRYQTKILTIPRSLKRLSRPSDPEFRSPPFWNNTIFLPSRHSQPAFIIRNRSGPQWVRMKVRRWGYLILFGNLVLRGGVGGDCALVFHFGCVDGSRDLECWELHLRSWLYRFYLLTKEWIDVHRWIWTISRSWEIPAKSPA